MKAPPRLYRILSKDAGNFGRHPLSTRARLDLRRFTFFCSQSIYFLDFFSTLLKCSPRLTRASGINFEKRLTTEQNDGSRGNDKKNTKSPKMGIHSKPKASYSLQGLPPH
jgi:hypothetical protein